MDKESLLRKAGALRETLLIPLQVDALRITILDVKHVHNPVGLLVPPHQHMWYELNILLEGTVYTTLGKGEICVNEGEAFLVPPGCVHGHRHEAADEELCMRFQLVCPKKEDVAWQIEQTFARQRPCAFDARMEELETDGGPFSVRLGFARWLIQMFERWNRADIPRPMLQEGTLSRRAYAYLLACYQQPIPVSQIAAELGVSYRQLSRVFKQDTGVSLVAKRNEMRIAQAKNLLAHTRRTVREIAAEVGFENEYYFSNTFRRYCRVSPTAYRRKKQMEHGVPSENAAL